MPAETSHHTKTSWSLVLPVKVLSRAKTRMAAAAGPLREALALAVAADTVAAALRCALVAEVIVVTDDPLAASELSALGARTVPDEPDRGLNPALAYGASVARRARPDVGVGAMSADLPALRPAELGRVLTAAAAFPESFVPDAAGVGTTLYAVRPGVPFSPAFGPDSRARHAAQGARELALEDIASVRRDVDTPDDLRAALALGAGPRTTALAARLPSLSPGAETSTG
ncbi:2-phospho-L-lactate guanylyltransferase [Thermomonospora amylolytica]|uniref:2-phospho-L-lactate guanylyltransferase n=1 Tax=Thermomonospora amylolytica TaxID=1411117 RepID=UPI000E6BC0EC|nr:2-phospho-L-lactate guanylyltransferase [Thermomonospora amylolytica]